MITIFSPFAPDSGGGVVPVPVVPSLGPGFDDMALVDNAEYVTFRSLVPGGTFQDTVTVFALRRALNRREVAALPSGALAAGMLVWNLRAADLGAVTPKTGDRVADASGAEWVVESCDYQTVLTRWRLSCRKRK